MGFRDRGIETPLVVLPTDSAGVHHIVAGHRRHAAAASAGLATVPCIVRDYGDEADVVLAMLAENTQRSDGPNIVDEAQALAAVVDLKGGTVSARKLAAATGHSESWVRTRLALLTLPEAALDALHAGLWMLPMALPTFLCAPVSGRPADVAVLLVLAERLRAVAVRGLAELEASGAYVGAGASSAAVWLRREQVLGADAARSTVRLAQRLLVAAQLLGEPCGVDGDAGLQREQLQELALDLVGPDPAARQVDREHAHQLAVGGVQRGEQRVQRVPRAVDVPAPRLRCRSRHGPTVPRAAPPPARRGRRAAPRPPARGGRGASRRSSQR